MALTENENLFGCPLTGKKTAADVDQLFSQIRNTMDSNLIKALVADFGLDLLKFNDEIRLGTLETPPPSLPERRTR
jgi:hypothetical protein